MSAKESLSRTCFITEGPVLIPEGYESSFDPSLDVSICASLKVESADGHEDAMTLIELIHHLSNPSQGRE